MNATAARIERPEPKSYLTEEEKVGLSQDDIYFFEACEANKAGDEDSFWYWFAKVELADSTKRVGKIF
ncbi:MAG: hypothetical protein LBI31_06290, partial [Zoogloeaceae bacterium]|nr:hypothetical protein [Zoogloeaceae bacterium]